MSKKSNRTVNVSKLSKSCQALNPGLQQALDGGARLTVRLEEAVQADPGSPVAKTTPKVKAGPQMTQTEREFKAMLEQEFPEATVLFERYTFLLSTDCRYSPDFAVVWEAEEKYDPDTISFTKWVRIQFYEVKAQHLFKGATKSMTAATLVKPKLAAELFPWHRWFRATKAKDGSWSREEYRAAQ